MARLIPHIFPYESDTSVWAEKTFFDACQSQLNDDWHVLYSQRYVGERPSLRQDKGSGEIDFILLNKMFGVLAVEIKGGHIDINEGQWFSSNKNGRHLIKNPFLQAEEGARAILTTLKKELPNLELKDCVHHCVVFPAVSGNYVGNSGNISTYGHREITIYKEDLTNLARKIEKVVSYWSQKPRWSDANFKLIRNVLIPTTKTPGISYLEYLNILKDLDRLTESQERTIRQLTRDKGKSIVTGGAGTGKTVLGMARAQQLAQEGKKVLYLCATGSLSLHLQSEIASLGPPISQNLEVETASGLITKVGRAGTAGDDFTQRKKLIPSRADRFIDSISKENREGTIDCLVVDEAQDISKEDLALVEFLVKAPEEGGSVIILGDPNQQLMLGRIESALGPEEQSQSHPLDVNCRNTKEIASIAHSFTNQLVDTLETISGIKVKTHQLRGELDVQVAVEIESIRQEYDPSQIIVLTLNGLEDLSTNDTRFVDGQRWESRNQQRASDLSETTLVYSARSFQGRDADAVVVALTEKSILRTFPFMRFVSEMRQNKRVISRSESQNDLRRVHMTFDRFRETVAEKLVPSFKMELDESGSEFTDKRKEFLIREFQRAREMEFDPRFRDPILKSLWIERQKQSLRVSLYSMMTRARVILTVIGDASALEFINTELNREDETIREYFQDT